MDEQEKELRRKVTQAKRQRSKWESRYFEYRAEFEAKYGDKVLSEAYKKRVPGKKEKTVKKAAAVTKPIPKKGGVECDGNVVTGEACTVSQKERVKAPDTKWEKKTYHSCKTCKKLIQKAKKEKKE